MRGSIKRSGKSSWRVRVDAPPDPITGRRRQISRNVTGRKAEAEAELQRILEDLGRGRHRGTDATVAELLERYLDSVDVTAKVVEDYERIVRLHLRPRLGGVPLSKLHVSHVDDLYAAMRKTHKPASIRKVHNVLRAALDEGIRIEWIDTNVAERARPPKVPKARVGLPNEAAVERLVRKLEGELAVFLLLAMTTGARRGELCALRWSDLDGSVLTIQRAVVAVKGVLVVKATKEEDIRKLRLDAGTVAALGSWRTSCAGRLLAVGRPLQPDDYVFMARNFGPVRPEVIGGRFARARKAAKAEGVKLHQLRHRVASLLIAAGVDVVTVANRLGHSNPSTTLNIYGHLIDRADQAAADVLGKAARKKSG